MVQAYSNKAVFETSRACSQPDASAKLPADFSS